MELTKENKDLLYRACLSYGDSLCEISKKIRVPKANEIILNEAKAAWELGKRIIETA